MKDKYEIDFNAKKKKAKREVEELNRLKSNTEFEKGDFLALLIAAMTTILPFVVVILLIYYAISMLFFG